MKYWLLKSEPSTFSIDHLAQLPNQTDMWEGVRNFQARNMIRDEMQVGDLAFFYHSNSNPIGVVGIVEITSAAYPDPTQFNPDSAYFDAKSKQDDPRWFVVDVKLVSKFTEIIALSQLKLTKGLQDFMLLRKGNRLSVMPVSKREWEIIAQQASKK